MNLPRNEHMYGVVLPMTYSLIDAEETRVGNSVTSHFDFYITDDLGFPVNMPGVEPARVWIMLNASHN